MTPAASDLVFVLPTDTVATVGEKIRASGARELQLLVADSTPALQSPDGFAQLGQLALRGGVRLTVISSDEQTLAAAQQAQLDVIGIDGARVALDPPPDTADAYATRVLPREDDAPYSAHDSHFLDALDQDALDRLPAYDDPRFDEFDDFGSIDRAEQRYDDDLDEAYVPPRRRPLEHIEDVTPESLPVRAPGPRRPRQPVPSVPARGRGATTNPRALPQRVQPRYDEQERAPRRESVLPPILVGVLLALLLAAGYYYVNRPVVTVWPPPGEISTTNYQNVVLPLSAAASADSSAVQAVALSAPAEVTVQGQASKQLSPAGTARGIVQIINRLSNPIALPADTQFIATNAAGQQVSFLIDAPQTIPAAVYSQSEFGSSTQYGNLEIAISARSPGSASNVGENSVTQLLIPGQPAIGNSEQVSIRNLPIEGGSEAEIFVVGQQDVNNLLGSALAQLYAEGAAVLRAQSMPASFTIAADTVYPGPDVLGDPTNYEVAGLDPPVGQPVVDQNNPVFTLQLRASFNALATPSEQNLEAQLDGIVPTVLEQQKNGNLCASGEDVGFDPVSYRWDGRQLAAAGAYTCTPRGALADAALSQVRSAVVGQSTASARSSLDQLVQDGQIGGYQLPPGLSEFPGVGFMIQVERASGSPPAAPSAVPQPSAPAAATPGATQ